MWTARLSFAFPEVMSRSCDDCERFMYEDKPGKLGPLIVLESGEPMKRPVGVTTPCFMCPKLPKSAPARTRAHAIEPSEKSLAALEHYRRCRAVGRFPEDAIVEWNAGLIAPIERDAELASQTEVAGLIATLLAGGK